MKAFLDWLQKAVAAFIPMQVGTRSTAIGFTAVLALFVTAWWAPGIKDQPELRAQILGPTGTVPVVLGLVVVRRVLDKSGNGTPAP
ncbi:MAG: hypothetical protein ABFE07_06540 [Armatimonadia bacterium]